MQRYRQKASKILFSVGLVEFPPNIAPNFGYLVEIEICAYFELVSVEHPCPSKPS